MTYGFVLYGLVLVSFTLYPMPDNPAKFCADYNLSPQLIPFASIMEISSEGLRAALQVGMNLLFFVPLGIFGKLLFRWKIWKVVLAGFVTSLLIETAQLTVRLEFIRVAIGCLMLTICFSIRWARYLVT